MAREAVFIGYRRDDTADVAGRIYDALAGRFGRNRIFKDVDNIPPGADFGDYIKAILPRCRVVLVLIGPSWVDAKDEAGRRRLLDPNDWVRVEIETALASGDLDVVPVLVNGARMPRAEEIPESLHPLLRRHAAIVRRDPDFHVDVDRLAAALRSSVRTGVLDLGSLDGQRHATPSRTRPASRALMIAAAVAVAASIAVLVLSPWKYVAAPNDSLQTGVAPQAQLQRGWQVYREVCSACHALGEGFTYAALGVEGGPLWNERFPDPSQNPLVRETAAAFQVAAVNDDGEPATRAATPTDEIVHPFANIVDAIAANGGAAPPDLLSYVQAAPSGGEQVLAFLRGYTDAPRGVNVRDGAYYNAAVGETRMPPPLTDGQVLYEDGTDATRARMAEDVAVFVAWANRALVAEGAPFIARERGANAGASPDFDLAFGDGAVLAELARRGEAVAAKCTACHSFEEGGAASVGPNLNDVFGSPVASAPGFQYSEAMLARGGRWDASALYAFVASPTEAVPGTSMSFAGLGDEADRLAIVAYLKSISAERAP